MRSLVFEEIDTWWQKKADMKTGDAPQLIGRMGEKQPSTLSYFLAINDEILSAPEREVILYMGVLIWYTVDSLDIPLPEITLQDLLDNEVKNIRMLEYLAGEPESEFMKTVGKIMEHYNQSDLLRYIIERIMDELQNDTEINRNHIGMMVIYLKTFIDCLDAAA